MAAEDRNGEVSTLGECTDCSDTTRERSFDELAKSLAYGKLSRRSILRMLGGVLLGGALASIPGVAWAQRGGQSFRSCPPEADIRCGPECCEGFTRIPARCARVVRSVYARPGKLSVADLPTDVASLHSRYASTGSALALRRPPYVVTKPPTTSTAAAKKVGNHSVVITILSLVPYAAIPHAAMVSAALFGVKRASMDSASAPRGLRVAMYAAQTLACAAATGLLVSAAIPH
jgi:hypothetical protein